MKKITSIALVTLMAASITSCTKDYTCECTVWGITSSDTKEMKKKDAKDWCEENNQAAATWGGSCELK